MTSDHKHTNDPPPTRPGDEASVLEDLAALADGTLSPERRADVLARLADDPEALDILAEVMAIQEAESAEDLSAEDTAASDTAEKAGDEVSDGEADDETETPGRETGGRVVQGPWPRRAWAAAATLAAVLALVVVTPRLLSPGPPTPELMLASLDVGAVDEASLRDGFWSPLRGGSVGSEIFEQVSPRDSFRLGQLDTTLAVTIEAQDEPSRRALAGQLSEIQMPGFLRSIYRDLLQTDTPRQALTEHFADHDSLVQLVEPFYYRYGLWVRAAELAAASGQVDFFQGRGAASLEALTPPADLVEEWRTLIRDVESAKTEDDLEMLAARLETIRRRHVN